ncbi:MAG: DNA-binding domain-containing protein [Burkholderiales bacterium]
MPTLADLQRRFAAALLAGEAPAHAGLATYRATVFANWRNALGATFGVVRTLTGDTFFAAAVDAFARAHPSRGGDLNVYGDAFAGFLAAWPPAHDLPYLPDVARLEWAMDEANRAAAAPGTAQDVIEALARVPPERFEALRFALDPSCRLLQPAFPVLRIWRAHQPGGEPLEGIDVAAGGEHLLVRRESGGVSVERVGTALHAWLAALQAGATLAAALDAALAVDASFDLVPALRGRVADGTLAALA